MSTTNIAPRLTPVQTFSIVLCAVGMLLCVGRQSDATEYSFSNLGTINGPNQGFLAYRVNIHGNVAGNRNIPGPVHDGESTVVSIPVVLNGNTLTQLDPYLGLPESYSWSFNDAGQSAGSSGSSEFGFSVPVRWDGITPVPLDTLVDAGFSSAYHMNNQAQIVGQSWTGTSDHAVRWDGTTITDLGTLGGTSSSADDISESGDIVVGRAQTTNDEAERAVYWDNVGIHDLGTLGGTNSYSLIMNDSHQIIGASALPGDEANHAVLWNGLDADPVDLGSLGGDSIAWFINNAGTIVGESALADGSTHATLWQDGTLIDLNEYLPSELRAAGWYLQSAQSINEHGVIVGWMNHVDPTQTLGASFQLTPVPVPAAVWLFGSGLAGLMGVLRRRRSKA